MIQRKMLWIGVCLLSAGLGCQSRRQQCVTCCACEMPVQTVVVTQTQPVPDPVVKAVPVTTGEVEESEPVANVALNAVAPGMHEGTQSTGTVVFTPPEAKTLGIKPGVTPTALWVPSRATSEMIATHEE